MDHLPPGRRHRGLPARRLTRLALAAGVAVVVASLAACSTVEAFSDLDGDLRSAGFTSTQVTVAGGDPVVLVVSADAPAGDTTTEGHEQAAELIWDRFPRRFEAARLTIDDDTRTVTRAELQEQFGDRPNGLDEGGDLADEVGRLGLGLLLGVLVLGLVLVFVAGLVTLLVVRARRAARLQAAGHGGHPGPLATPVPWAPPPAGPMPPAPSPTGPVPPPAGWAPAAPAPGWDEPRDPADPDPQPSMAAADAASEPPATSEDRAERRRLGRRPRGPRPPATQLPPGWD